VAIDLADDPDGRLNTVYARAKNAPAGERFPISRAVVRRVTRDKAAVLVANAKAEIGTESVMRADIVSSIGVPLWDGDTIRGVLHCDNRGAGISSRVTSTWSPPSPAWPRWPSRTRASCSASSWPRRSCAVRSST